MMCHAIMAHTSHRHYIIHMWSALSNEHHSSFRSAFANKWRKYDINQNRWKTPWNAITWNNYGNFLLSNFNRMEWKFFPKCRNAKAMTVSVGMNNWRYSSFISEPTDAYSQTHTHRHTDTWRRFNKNKNGFEVFWHWHCWRPHIVNPHH